MANKHRIEYQIGTEQAARALEELTALADRLEQSLTKSAGKLGSSAAADPSVRADLQEYAMATGAAGAVKAIQASALASRAGVQQAGVADAMLAGAREGIKNLQSLDPRLGLGAVVEAVKQLGASSSYTPQADPRGFAQGVVEMIQASSRVTQRLSLPSGYESSGPYSVASLGGGLPAPTVQMNAAQMQYAITGGMPFANWNTPAPLMAAHAFLASRAGQGMAAAGAYGFGNLLSISAQETISGHTDVMGRARAWGNLIGGALGAPFGLLGAGVGAMLGGSVMEWLAAPTVQQEQIAGSFAPAMGLKGWGGFNHLSIWSQGLASRLSTNVNPLSAQGIGAAYSMLFQGVVTGGVMPGEARGAPPNMLPMLPGNATSTLIENMRRQAINTIRMTDWMANPGDTVERITERLAFRYRNDNALQSAANRVANIYGARPETGDNLADILARFGPTATHDYLISQVAPGVVPAMGLAELAERSAGIRSADREARMALLRTGGGRGAGAMDAFARQMEVIRGIPGGGDSLAMAEARNNFAGAQDIAFREDDLSGYALRRMRLSNIERRMMAGPFNPGNRLTISLANIALSRARIGELRSRMATLGEQGNLSPERRFEMESEIEGLVTGNYEALANLAEDGPNRMAALSAGRPAFFSRMDSRQLAAMHFFRMEHPRRGFGGVNGAQITMQDDFFQQLGFDAGSAGPWSRTAGFNNGGGTERIEGLLERILAAIESGSDSGGHPGELMGRAWAGMQGKNLSRASRLRGAN